MKTRLLRDRKAGALTLQITPSKHELFEYSQAEWLYYDLTGLVNLQTYLKAAISLSQYRVLLVSLANVMDACTQKGFPTASLLCDPSLVYVDAAGTPRFVYAPLSGMAEKSENTPLSLLHYLSSKKHVTFAVASDSSHAAALDDFVSRNAVLSLSAYRSFLSSEFGSVLLVYLQIMMVVRTLLLKRPAIRVACSTTHHRVKVQPLLPLRLILLQCCEMLHLQLR